MRLLSFFVSLLLFGAMTSCVSLDPESPMLVGEGGCAPVIEYQGRRYDVGAAWHFLGLKAGTKVESVREVSDLLQVYFDTSRFYCEQHRDGKIDTAEYLRLRGDLAERFGSLAGLAKVRPDEQDAPVEKGFYSEMLQTLRPDMGAASPRVRLKVLADGREIPNGAKLRTGETFRLVADLPSKAYLYVALIDSQGKPVRLYPTSRTGEENPVSGPRMIPPEGVPPFILYGQTGEERLLVFALPKPSPSLEMLFAEVETAPNGTRQAGASLTRCVGIAQALTPTKTANGEALQTVLGHAALQFVLHHVAADENDDDSKDRW